jgi:hypothetical protein
MLNERITDLIQADVDGELADHDRAELSRELLQSQEARKFRDDMIRIKELMASIPSLDPPAGLQQKIISAIKLPRRGPFSARTSGWPKFASYGLALAAGVVMGIGLAQVNPRETQDLSAVVGTMMSQPEGQQGSAGRTLAVSLDYVQGNIKRSYLGQTVALEFDLKSVEPVEITVDLNGTGMRFGGFADQDLSPAIEEFEVSKEQVHLLSTGSQHYVLFLRKGLEGATNPQDIGISLAQHGTNIYQGQLDSGQ